MLSQLKQASVIRLAVVLHSSVYGYINVFISENFSPITSNILFVFLVLSTAIVKISKR
jgi:hypothetical protein